jgi:hypothetical protein
MKLFLKKRALLLRKRQIQNPKSQIQNRHGGKGGIRTHGTLLRFTAFPMLPIQPLLHLSVKLFVFKEKRISNPKSEIINLKSNGGEGGIRTHGTR